MLATLGLVAAGFVLGVSLTAIVAASIVGMIHAEAVKVVDGHLAGFGLALHSDGRAQRGADIAHTAPQGI